MDSQLRWRDYLAINVQWLGLNTVTGTITPLLLPFLVALMAPPAEKNTYLATIRVVSLAVAMAVQPIAGLLSDRSTAGWGRRRPYIAGGAIGSVVFLILIGASPLLHRGVPGGLTSLLQPVRGASAGYALLLIGVVMWQACSNTSQGALQGLIPDLVPAARRGRASGVKSVMELLPVLVIVFLGPLVDSGDIGQVLVWIAGILAGTTLITALFVHEEPRSEAPTDGISRQVLRLVGLAAIFVVATQAAVWLVQRAGDILSAWQPSLTVQVLVIGLAGVLGMTGAILFGVYFGTRVGLGPESRSNKPFVWWVVNRLLFLAAVGSIQGFTLYYLADVHDVANPAALTTTVLVAIAAFLVPSALVGGYISDRIGRRRLVAVAGVVAACGTLLLILAPGIPVVMAGACAIGGATGLFMATNWALGTDLVPAQDAGRYLGISNLAGAGAGIVGVGIGGPLADSFNSLRPGLGYLVVFGIYGMLFLLSVAALSRISRTRDSAHQRVPSA